MKGGIFVLDYKKGLEELELIVEKYLRINIKCVLYLKTKQNSRVEFENGDCWQVLPAIESIRGAAFNIAYIERGINEDFIQCVIMPMLKAYPYTAWRYI